MESFDVWVRRKYRDEVTALVNERVMIILPGLENPFGDRCARRRPVVPGRRLCPDLRFVIRVLQWRDQCWRGAAAR